MRRSTLATLALAAALILAVTPTLAQDEATDTPDGTSGAVESGYADINGLHMYYEIHGSGKPLIVMHGAYMTIDAMGALISELAQTRQVIAVELQAHGRTDDTDRPLSYEALADDIVALMDDLGIQQADLFGYSLGGAVGLQVAIRYPERVNKLVSASATYTSEAYHPGMQEMFEMLTPEMFVGSPMEDEYLRLNPGNPEGFIALATRLIELDSQPMSWPEESVQGISAPTLLIFGDSDIVTLQHVVDLFGLRGGNVNGDLDGLPQSQLAIVPGTSHTSVLARVNLLVPIITEFLDDTIPVPSFQP